MPLPLPKVIESLNWGGDDRRNILTGLRKEEPYDNYGEDINELIPPLLDSLEDDNWVVVGEAATVIGQIAARDSIPELTKTVQPLIRILENGPEQVRRDAITALGQIGAPAASAMSAIEAFAKPRSQDEWWANRAIDQIRESVKRHES